MCSLFKKIFAVVLSVALVMSFVFTNAFISSADSGDYTGGYEPVVDIPAHDHDYHAVVTSPTCTEQGYTTYTCSICGYSYKDTYTNALGHTGGTATCHSKAVCTRCHEEYGEFDANNHDGDTEIRGAIAETCTTDGYTGDTYCKGCGEKIADGSVIVAPGHSYVAVVTDPTCTERGYTTHTCSRCKDSYVDSYTDALGHNVGEWESDANSHWHVCSVCKQNVDISAHIEGDWIIDDEPSADSVGHKHKECTVCGYVLKTADIPFESSHTPGDINDDGEVDNQDLVALFQYLSDWNVTVNEDALDVNGDGEANNQDLTRLFQYVSDWDVEIF